MNHFRLLALKNLWRYSPRLEILEDRLPPGDAVLGLLVGASLADGNALLTYPDAIAATPNAMPLAISENDQAQETLVLHCSPQSPAMTNVARTETVSQSSAQEKPHVWDANPLAGALPARERGAVRVARSLDSAATHKATAIPDTFVVGPFAGKVSAQPVSSHENLGPNALSLSRPTGEDPGEEGAPPPAPFFAQGTGESYVEQVHQGINRLWGSDPRYWLTNRWSGTQGSPRNLTWSFVPDGLSISSGIGEGVAPSEVFSRLDSLFASQGGRPTWINRFQQVFDRWEQLTGIDYTRVTSSGNDWDDGASWGSGGSATRGDIRISMKPIDGASNVLAYNYFPSNGDMVLDRQESWGSSGNSHRFLRNIVAHENGHGIGINHMCCSTHVMLMEPFLSTSVDGPQHDDIRAAQRHYGDPFEDDNSSGVATNIGTLTSGVTKSDTCNLPAPVSGTNPASTSNCTIDGDGEQDYFRFTVGSASEVDITVTPLGFAYNDNQQNTNGTCQTGSTTNSLTKANLNVQLIDQNGTTVLATAASQAIGLSETITNHVVPAGSYYIRVYEGEAQTQSQSYTFSVRSDATSAATHLGVSAPSNTTAGTSENITVTALNSSELPDVNYQGTVHFTSSDPQAVLPPDYAYIPGDQGVHNFTATLKTAGSQTITATDTVNGSINGSAVIQVDPATAATLQVSGFPSPTTAGDEHMVTVTARDAYGNTASGYTGTVDLTSSDGQATLPADYTFTAGDAGVKLLPVTLKTAGIQSITATDTVTGTITGTQSAITVSAAAAASYDLTTNVNSTWKGKPFNVTLAAYDAYQNIATGYTETVDFTSSDPLAILPADYTFVVGDQGSHSFLVTLNTAGSQSVSATDTVNGSLTDNVTVTVKNLLPDPADIRPV